MSRLWKGNVRNGVYISVIDENLIKVTRDGIEKAVSLAVFRRIWFTPVFTLCLATPIVGKLCENVHG